MIIHGDSLAEMKKMPAESVGIVVTSPPYNIAASFHNSESSKGWYRKMGKGQRYTAHGGGGYDETGAPVATLQDAGGDGKI